MLTLYSVDLKDPLMFFSVTKWKSDHVHSLLTNYNGYLVLVGGFLDGGNRNIERVVFENEVGTWDIVGQMNVEDQYFGVNIASWKQSKVELNHYIYAFDGYRMYNDDLIVESNKVLRNNRLVTEFKTSFSFFNKLRII